MFSMELPSSSKANSDSLAISVINYNTFKDLIQAAYNTITFNKAIC